MKSQSFRVADLAFKSDEKKHSLLLWGIIFILGVCVFYLFSLGYGARKVPLPYEYSAQDLYSGKAVSLSQYRDSAVVLMSWATWCMDCKDELAALERLWDSMHERGLVVIAVNLDAVEANKQIEDMVNQYDLSYPIWRDPENTFFSTFNAPGIPTTVLLDKQGTVVRAWVGPVDFEVWDVREDIEDVLVQ